MGDGGRAQRKKVKESARAKRDETAGADSVMQKLRETGSSCFNALKSLNPIAFLCRIYNEDKISSFFWVTLFLLINFIIFD